ncbi:Penicillin-insensitive transglycosylase & transpeptidase PBP-1C [Citrobacter freundii]|uniref:Penicillin-insensitive transglycosylase & transpeptidase PBP-1C n=1 Tax=Citrobacter freundii TaxID=546 RepID=A0A7G2IXB1_CITFR|nr:Penicillin-insensitive transglycosylase & transpeptidase PBP-1C [Citrobacter freundii]
MSRGEPGTIDRGIFDSGFHGPVSMSEALVRSLNLPAVQVLEAYGPKRFCRIVT